jgi:hypothetical protein
MSEHPPESVIIVHKSDSAIFLFKPILGKLGLMKDTDYLLFTNFGREMKREFEKTIFKNKPQLLFIDSVSGDMRPTIELVKEIRQRNKQVVVILCDWIHYSQPGIFDKIIHMNLAGEVNSFGSEIAQAITDFRSGKLCHTVK